jgi:hypothetical protein
MNARKFLAAHPSVFGITIGLVILAYIIVTIISKR